MHPWHDIALKILENKAVTIEDMRGRDGAEREIRDATRLYREKIRPGVSESALLRSA